MAEIIFRLPSKKVQYGYAEIKLMPEDLPNWDGSPEGLGDFYYNYVTRFHQGEREASDAINRKPDPDLMTEEAAEELIKKPDPDLMTEEAAEELIKTELGATVVSDDTAPWQAPAKAPEEKKPWQNTASTVGDLFAD